MDDSSQEEFHLGIDSESENEYVAEEEDEEVEGKEGWSRLSNRKRFRSTSSSDYDEVVAKPREGNNTLRLSQEINSPSPVARVESEDGKLGDIGLQDVPSEDEQERESVAPMGVTAIDDRSVPFSSEAGTVGVASTCFCGGGSRSGIIKCGSCGGSYHGDCVGVTRQRAALLEQFHCPSCMSRDPSLVTVFREEAEGGGEEENEPVERATGPRKRTSNMCGVLTQLCDVLEGRGSAGGRGRKGRGSAGRRGRKGRGGGCWWKESDPLVAGKTAKQYSSVLSCKS